MAIRGGPDIIEDGLVLHLDAAEPLCFRGEPTTNLMPYTNGVAGRVGWPGGAYTHSIETTGEFAGWEKIVATTTGSIANTVMRVGDVSCAANTQYTATMEFYSPYNNLKFNVSGSYGNYNGIRIGNSNRYYVTFTKNSTTGNQGWWLLTTASTPANTAISNGVIYYRRAQFEQKSYYTDFVEGTRGSTVATGGGLLDLTNNGNNGTITRAAVPSTAFYTGDNKGSWVFNGVEDYVALSLSDNLKNANYTISAFVKSSIDIQTGTPERYIYYFRGTTNGSNRFGVLVGFSSNVGSNNGKLSLIIGNGGWNGYFSAKNFWSSNTWYHIAVTQLGSAYKMYVNGDLTDSGTAVSPSFSGMDQNSFGLKWNGFQSYLSVYNRALTALEIRQNYNATKGRFGL